MTRQTIRDTVGHCECVLSNGRLAREGKANKSIIQKRRSQMRAVTCDLNGGLKSISKEGISLNSYRMRQGPNAKRSQGRGNGRAGGNSRNQRGGGKGPAVRGNARQIMEKYLALAREASTSGDRIVAEGYFQHAEHYFRVMTANGRDTDEREHHPQPQPSNVEDQPNSDPAEDQPARRD